VRELVRAMEAYLTERNLAPKRYVWKKKGEEILAKISRARTAQAAASQYDPSFNEHYTRWDGSSWSALGSGAQLLRSGGERDRPLQ